MSTIAGNGAAPLKVKERRRNWTRRIVARTLYRAGLLDGVRDIRSRLRAERNPEIAFREQKLRKGFPEFQRKYQVALANAINPGRTTRTALLIGRGILEAELVLIKSLQSAGFEPVVLFRDDQRALRPYYEIAGVKKFCTWTQFSVSPLVFDHEADSVMKRCQSLDELVEFHRGEFRVGRIAASSTIRDLRVGVLPFEDTAMREKVTARVSESLAATEQANRILGSVKPDLAIFWDTEYTPKGEVFDACLAAGVDVVAYGAAHNANGLMFKRYTRETSTNHLASLSSLTWEKIGQLALTETMKARLHEETLGRYVKGDWFRKAWTQTNTREASAAEIKASLGLDSDKPTVVIFPNILSDSPLLWSKMLFSTYEDWLIETVRAACDNKNLNWVIKIHPANVGRRIKDRFHGDPPEMIALQRKLGSLPPHIVIVPPDTPIATSSFFNVMDYCVTVRGTVGIEAARMGIPVVTAARSRYSHRGFTIDSVSREEFLSRIASIERAPPLSREQRELAERFAYGTFVLRPLVMESVTWDYGVIGSTPCGTIHLRSEDDWTSAGDIKSWIDWIANSRNEDFLSGECVGV